MNNQELYMRVKQSFNNKEEMIELFALQAKETNNPVYWYTLFKYLNNFYIDFNKEEVKGFEYLSYAIQLEERNGFILGDKSYYKLDYEYMVLLSDIDKNALNMVASATIPLYHYVDGLNYIDSIDYEKFSNYSFDPDYLIYAPKTYSNHVRVSYKCSLLCYKLIDEKYFEKEIYKNLLKLKINYHKDLKNYKSLSDYDKVTLLKKYSSIIYSK